MKSDLITRQDDPRIHYADKVMPDGAYLELFRESLEAFLGNRALETEEESRIRKECEECLADRIEFSDGREPVSCEHCRDKLNLLNAAVALRIELEAALEREAHLREREKRLRDALECIIELRQHNGGPCDKRCEGCSECVATKALAKETPDA